MNNAPVLAAARLPQLVNGAIGQLAAAHLHAIVEPWPGMQAGDLLELFWDGLFIASRLIYAHDLGQPTRLRIPPGFIQPPLGVLHYQILKIGEAPWVSPRCTVAVKLLAPGDACNAARQAENPQLASVSFADSLLRHGVNSRHLKRGVAFRIAPYAHMAALDAITLRWGDVSLDLAPLTTADLGLPIKGRVPAAVAFEAGPDEHLEVTYSVIDYVGNHSGWAPVTRLRVLSPVTC